MEGNRGRLPILETFLYALAGMISYAPLTLQQYFVGLVITRFYLYSATNDILSYSTAIVAKN